MRRAVMVAVLSIAAACGKGRPSKQACDAYRAELDALAHGPPKGFPSDEARPSVDDVLSPPVVAHGHAILETDERTLPGVVFQRPPPPGGNDVPPPPPPPLPLPGAAPPAALYVFADHAAPVRAVRDEVARWPDATEVRLVVQRPVSERIDLVARMAPVSPAVRDVLATAPDGKLPAPNAAADPIRDRARAEIVRRGAACSGIAPALDLASKGGAIDVIAPRLASALGDCGCDAGDLDELRALFLASTLPLPRTAYVVVPRAALAAQPDEATIADLARAVAK